MDKNLFNAEDLEDLLSQLATEDNSSKKAIVNDDKMTKEMEASQRRYEEYIKKNQSN